MLTFVEHPHDNVRVFVDFDYKKVKPTAFFWAGKRYDIASVNLVYKRRNGDHHDMCFAVSDAANTYVLRYNPENMEWILDEVQGT